MKINEFKKTGNSVKIASLTQEHGAVHHDRRAGLCGGCRRGRLLSGRHGQVAGLQPGKEQAAKHQVGGGNQGDPQRGEEEEGAPPAHRLALVGPPGERGTAARPAATTRL